MPEDYSLMLCKSLLNIYKICVLQVNLCQKHSFLNQLTHNTTTDCSLITDFSTRKIQVQNMLCTKIVFCFCFGIQNNFCTQHVLNLYFSCIEVSIQRTICCHTRLTDSRVSASEKDLPVQKDFENLSILRNLQTFPSP